MNKPLKGEYPGFYTQYINLIEEGDITEILSSQSGELQEILSNISEEKSGTSYAFGKWTIKEVTGHLIDFERIMSARALRIARNDKQHLPGFDQDNYTREGRFFRRTLEELKEELLVVRASSLILFRTFDDEILFRRGIFNDNEITARAIPYIIAGHERYHINFLKDNYLS